MSSSVAPTGTSIQTTTRRPSKSLVVLTVVGFALPIVVYFWLIQHFSINAPYQDQWSDLDVIAHSYSGTLSLSTLWLQHVDNRILFPNLFVLLLTYTTHFNLIAEEYISGLMLCAATGLLVWTHKRRSPSTPWIFYCPVAILMLSIVQYQSTLWGFTVGWYLVLLSLTVVLFLLDRWTLTWPVLAAAIAWAVIGSYSATQGLLIWPTGLVLLYYRRRRGALTITWLAAAGLTGAVYLHGLNTKVATLGGPQLYLLHHPITAIRSVLYLVGDVVGARTTNNSAVLAVGVLIVLLAVYVVSAQGFRREDEGAGPLSIALISYGLMFAAVVTKGRLFGSIAYADASRFTTYELLIVVGLYLAVIGSRHREVLRSQRRPSRFPIPGLGYVNERPINRSLGGHATLVIAQVALIIIICIQIGFGIGNGLAGARADQATKRSVAHLFVDADMYSDYTLSGGFPFGVADGVYVATTIRQLAGMAKRHHLALFASPSEIADAERPVPGDSSRRVTSVIEPSNGRGLRGSQLLTASTSDEFRVTEVDFRLTGVGVRSALIGVGKSSYVGSTEVWRTEWNTVGVPNGTYGIQSVLYDASGNVTASTPVSVTVAN